MKVIAHTGNSYIIEVKDFELQKITAHHVPNRSGSYPSTPISVGTEIEVYKPWEKLAAIIAAPDEIGKRAASLRAIADMLDQTGDLVKRAVDAAPPVPTQPSSEPA